MKTRRASVTVGTVTGSWHVPLHLVTCRDDGTTKKFGLMLCLASDRRKPGLLRSLRSPDPSLLRSGGI